MKTLILLSLLFSTSTFAIKEKGGKGIYIANRVLVQEVSKQYLEVMVKNIKRYNDNRKDINKLIDLTVSKEKGVQLKKRIQKYKIDTLPPIHYENGIGVLKIGRNIIKFNSKTLFEGYFVVNRKVVNFRTSQEELEKQIKESLSKKVTFTFSFIRSAYASDADFIYDHAVFATTIVLTETFKEMEWCMRCEDEKVSQTKENFEVILGKISELATSCKHDLNEADNETFAWSMEMMLDTDYISGTEDLEAKLKDFFPSYDSGVFTCESFVKKLYDEEIKKDYKKVGFYNDSVKLKRAREHNRNAYEKYVKVKCQPYVDLRNCLIDKSYTAREIYNDLRKQDGKGRIRSTRTLNKIYDLKGSSRE